MISVKDELQFAEIMQRVASIIEIERGKKPYDKEVAYELGLSQTQYANNKKRNKIPYREIALFCDKRTITINWILLGKSSMQLIQREEDIYKIRVIENINGSPKGGEYNDEESRIQALEGMHIERYNFYISIDRAKKRCYATDYRGSELDHYDRGVLAELESSAAVMVEMEFDINLTDYGVSLIYNKPKVSQPWDFFWEVLTIHTIKIMKNEVK